MAHVVYGILCHNSSEYVQEQYRLLYRPETRFIYHADEKSPAGLKDLLSRLALSNPNVSVITPLMCSWAGFSLTQAMLNIIGAATQLENWDHLVFLSELHLPLQNHEYISWTFEPNHNYIEASPYTTFYEAGKVDIFNRSSQIYRELPGVGAFGTKQNDPGSAFFDRLRHGSQWMTLCRTTCLQLAKAGDGNSLEVFQHTVLSDENALQSWVAALNNDTVTNVSRIVTYVADPSRGGTSDMTFDEDLFFTARDKGYLFIRKRSASIPPRVYAYFDEIFPAASRPPQLELRTIDPTFNQVLAAQNLIYFLNKEAADSGIEFVAMKPSIGSPNLFAKVLHPSLKSPFNVYVVSQDLFHFKVLVVMSDSFKGFADSQVGGYRASVVRARLADISFSREVHLAEDLDYGFYTAKKLSDLHELMALVLLHVSRTESLVVA
jgi:hypothetical protein